MFIKLTLQDTGAEIYVNFDDVNFFYDRPELGDNSWTSVHTNERTFECCETAIWICKTLEGGR